MVGTSKLRLSKGLMIIFTVIQIFLGVHFGFVKTVPRKWRIYLKLICVFCSACVLAILFIQRDDGPDHIFIYILLYAGEFITCSITLLFSEYTFYDFLLDISEIDVNLKLNDNSLDRIVAMAILLPIFSCTLKMSVHLAYCICSTGSDYCKLSNFEYVKSCIVVTASDSIILIQFIIMYTCYLRIKILKNKVLRKELEVSTIVGIYKSILDSLDKIKPIIDKMIVASMVFCVPKHMAIIYEALGTLKVDNDWASFALQYVILIQTSFISFLPAIMAELLNSDVDKIKLTMHNLLIETNDEEKRAELKGTLRYMYGRPSQYYIWRRIPVDLRLISCFFNIVSTYLIVIIQFTHLYD